MSNFYPDRFVDLAGFVDIKPMVNQVETHVFQQQQQAHDIMEEFGAVHESWAPFAEGKNDFFTNETLTTIGEKYGKTAAQVGLRYLLQRNIVIIPKTVTYERMKENIDVFDFELTEEEMDEILELDQGESLFFSHYDPEVVKNFIP